MTIEFSLYKFIYNGLKRNQFKLELSDEKCERAANHLVSYFENDNNSRTLCEYFTTERYKRVLKKEKENILKFKSEYEDKMMLHFRFITWFRDSLHELIIQLDIYRDCLEEIASNNAGFLDKLETKLKKVIAIANQSIGHTILNEFDRNERLDLYVSPLFQYHSLSMIEDISADILNFDYSGKK